MDFERSFAYHHPELLPQWSSGNDLSPDEVTKSSAKKIKWVCDKCGHHWVASCNDRHAGKGCPVCRGGRTIIPGVNDIATTHPQLIPLWDSSNKKKPTNTGIGSHQKITLTLPCGHQRTTRLLTVRKKLEDPLFDPSHLCLECLGEKSLAHHSPHIAAQATIDASTVSYNSAKKVKWVCSDNPSHTWTTTVYQRVNSNTGCPVCASKKTRSQGEIELYNYIQSILPGTKVIANDRTVLDGRELDIWIPDKKIAIEFNGLFYHCEKLVGRTYHKEKFKDCDKKNIQLITIWSDDWENRKPIVKKMLAHKLSVSTDPTVYARKTTVTDVDPQEAKLFCDTHHIQSHTNGSWYIGLRHNDDLVAVSVWTIRNNHLYLDRYCTSCNIPGGMGKLLREAQRRAATIPTLQSIVTFSDNCVSQGKLYETLGFTLDRELKEDYKYIINHQRVHKFNYRKSRFQHDENLYYNESLTESELAEYNNIEKIWDCGKKRWTKSLTTTPTPTTIENKLNNEKS